MSLRKDPIDRPLTPSAIALRLDACMEFGEPNLGEVSAGLHPIDRSIFSESPRRYAFALIPEHGELRWHHVVDAATWSALGARRRECLDVALIDNLIVSSSHILPEIERSAAKRQQLSPLSLVAPYLLECETDAEWRPSSLFRTIARDDVQELLRLCQTGALAATETVTGHAYALTGVVTLTTAPLLQFCVMIGSDPSLSCLLRSIDPGINEIAEALRWAIMLDNKEAIALLAASPEVINHQRSGLGSTALHVAVLNGNEFAVRTLLEAGADPTICNNNNETAIDIAEAEGEDALFELLSRCHRE